MTTSAVERLPSRRPTIGAMLAKLGPFVGLIFVLGFFSAMRPATFATHQTMEFILIHATVVITAALGQTMIIISGGIDLSVGSNIALCTVVCATALKAGCPPLLAAAAGVCAGALCGLLIGGFITGLGLVPFIATLVTWGGLRGAAEYLANDQMVRVPEAKLESWLSTLLNPPEQSWMILPVGVWLMIFLCLSMVAVLRYTRFGRHIFAIGSNEQTARLCGIPVKRTKLIIYTLAGALAGVAALMQFSELNMGDPTTATGMELDIIAAVVIGGASLSGGKGTVLGTVIGSLIMKSVDNGCTKMHVPNSIELMITSMIILAACTLDQLRVRRE
ncbi:MAG: ABC transporter permease [Tepidisphaeraceae bacterium]|jgi:ribose/xylose/arabinose/galactoside ABC-type transport system permease subunit